MGTIVRMSAEGATSVTRRPSGRGKAVLAIDWHPQSLPAATAISLHTLIAHDGEVSRATLYERAGGTATKSVFCLMHPRQDLQRHPAIPGLLEAGHAVWAQTGRNVGNDLTLVHESALLDVAAGMERLRELGYEQIVLVGISGGAGLYSFYTEQSLTAPADRIAETPSGAPVPLAEAPMPAPDQLALVAPHPGQGRLLLAMIDGSVADESDPLSTIDELDPFNAENGFAEEAEGGSHFEPEFLERYREAQRERVARIDERAHELGAARLTARKRFKSDQATELDRRASVLTPVITTYRSDADPRCTDLGLDPSERPYGSVISRKPSMSNFGVGGFGRLATPEAWLSTWSGISSNASLERSLKGITIPTLLIQYTGDCSVFPSDVRAALSALAAEDATHVQIRADHFGQPIVRGEDSGIPATVEQLCQWAAERSARP
jgi:pimeloyl-ACP methyl ester carboxylesterase